jgi:hypothetical protein
MYMRNGRGLRIVWVVFWVSLLISITSCLAKSRIGVMSSGEDHKPEVLVVHCSHVDTLRIRGIELIKKTSLIAASDDPGGRVIWKVASPGADLQRVTVGEKPNGFTEVKRLAEYPGPDDPLAIVVDAGITWDQSFTLRQLESNRVLYGGRLIALDDFQKEARSGGGCAGQVPRFLVSYLIAAGAVVVGAILFAERRRRRRNLRGVATS